MEFTPEQQKVIDLRNKNIIVSAAAGSGKTAVLTERIANKICNKENPSSIDRMLIVTFTNAAAGEMRERIGKRLREELAKDPDNTYLRKQIALIHTAQITTIDSFCLFILKNHFAEIGVDPSFRVCNEGERIKILNEAFDDTVEQLFLAESESFRNLVEMYAPKGKYGNLKEIIFALNSAASSTVFPRETLESLMVDKDTDVWEMPFIRYLIEYENFYIEEALKEFKKVKDLVGGTQLTKHLEEANGKISFLESLYDADFKRRTRLLADISKVDLKYGSKKFDEESLEVKDEATARIKRGQALIDKTVKEFHFTDEEKYGDLIKKGYECTNAIIEFLLLFMDNFDAKKREEGIIDFNDMEHMALEILAKKEDGKIVPTKTALSYRDFFDEVMIDEYQDSNDVQETILGIVSKDEESPVGNRFMVGDIKQSIYGFRLAKPDIFKEKCNTYKKDETQRDVRINLSNNFRSRKEVIDAVNFIFERIMKEEVGGVEYDEDERLNLGKKDYPEAQGNKAELLYFLKDDRKENVLTGKMNANELEAMMVAQRILELKEAETKVYDVKKDTMREMHYSDIAILLRATGGREVIFQKVLKKYGIPAYVISKNGYYSASEVQLILNFLSVIDNPRQDLPLLGVMHSFIGGFDEESIAKIRAQSQSKRLIDSLYLYLVQGDDDALKQKITAFTDELDSFKEKSLYMPASDLIREIYDRYEYTVMVSSMPGGEQRLANVKLLVDTADEYEEQGMYGIHDFIKSIEKLRSQEVDMGEANILDENANVVRIMTIHKSKGLEYPICFVSSLHTAFKGNSDKILFDDKFGIGGDAFDLSRRTKNLSPVRTAISTKKAVIDRGEEIRVLYVALTRAREKLIMTGELASDMESAESMGFVDLMEAKSFLNLIYPIIKENRELFDIRQFETSELRTTEIIKETDRISRKELVMSAQGHEYFREYRYTQTPLDNLFVKTTVSELKKAAYLEREDGENTLYHKEEKKVPKIVSDTGRENGGAERGSAYHRVMELMDFANIYDGDILENLRSHRAQMTEKLFIYEEDDALVDEKKILRFLETDLSKRMSEASKHGKLYLEQPFVLSVAANEVNDEFPEDERILVQGVIDVYFEEDGQLILMDYKTDRVDSGEELIARYKTQLDYYAEALSRLEKKKVAEVLIYSFSLGEVIKVQ
ncbi:MAG: helicase-exonuclease AddAB subunit AddA [Lachnospiraceae bacterium]|nr:helicase-exonuclease AddAB subunit AddA [Lachnospiraceae bacterium]